MLNIIFRDAPWMIAAIFIFLVWIMLPHLNPKAQEAKAATEPPGNLMASATWPQGDTDVDIWVDGPGEPNPVGYSNKSGVLWSLLRDDLGAMHDATPFNYENAYTRGIVAGKYTVNLMCYRCPDVPVPVDLEISVNPGRSGKGSMRPVATSRVVLFKSGQERTALSFTMDAKGNVDRASMNTVYRPLMAAK